MGLKCSLVYQKLMSLNKTQSSQNNSTPKSSFKILDKKNDSELSESSEFQFNYATVATTKQMIAQTMMKAKSAKVTFFKMPALVFSLFLP